MTSGLGKDALRIGSAPDNDLVLPGVGVAPHHARIVRQQGQLFFVSDGAGPSYANGAPLAPNQPAPFDFRTHFSVGSVQVPLVHPALARMLMADGELVPPPGQVVLGREPTRASIVVGHPAVSGQHAVFQLDRLTVTDQGSTSGTYVAGQRIPPHQPVPVDPTGAIALGPVPIPVSLLVQLAQGKSGSEAPQPMAGQAPASPGSPGSPGGAPAKHRTIIGELSLESLSGSVVTIGRTKENQIVVPHAQVSSRHAQILKQGNELFLMDLGSANGTFVRGQRLAANQRVPVTNGEKVYIGPMPLLIHLAGDQVNVVVEDQAGWAGKPLYDIEAWDLFLEVPDRDQKGSMKTLLDHVSFKALPGDMIALMGPSGAGKTTLLLTLNGYLPPTAGQVRINGEDLYQIYDALRGSIGYVPQDDIVHPELTVFEAVKYSARFRLPPDYSEEEIDRRVDETLRSLGLEGVQNLEIGKPERKVLSGGQRKRVNIALELVTDPVILFLDEPTSGLAADDTTALITLLHDLTRKTGKTIVLTIHQPAKDEFEKFNLCFIMGYGGIPTYFGPTGDAAYNFFASITDRAPGGHRHVDNPRDMFDMLNVREKLVLEEVRRKDPNAPRAVGRLEAARGWRAEFFQGNNPVFQQMFAGKRAVGTEAAERGVPHHSSVAVMRQLMLLMSRYWKVKIRDRAGAAIMFLQAPIIGGMLAFVFGGARDAVPFWCLGALQDLATRNRQAAQTNDLLGSMVPTADHSAAMFFVVVSAVWFGTSNSAREIVTERAIYLRERMVNLRLANYVVSKFVILSAVCVIQCTMLLGIVFFALGFHGGLQAFGVELLAMVAVSINATALGLLLSTVVSSAEAAMALTPIALIPQVVLGGLMVPMTTNPMLRPLMYVMPARWGFEGSIAQERVAVAQSSAWLIDLKQPTLTSLPDFVVGGHFQCAIAQMASDTIAGGWGFVEWADWYMAPAVLFGMTFLMLAVLLVLLKRRDPV